MGRPCGVAMWRFLRKKRHIAHLVPSVKAHALSASVLVLLELMVAAREMSK